MIKGVEKDQLEAVARYAHGLNLNPQNRCKAFPTVYNDIFKQFNKILNHKNDELLVLRDGINILGVLAIVVEPEDMYLEAIGGVFAEKNYEIVANKFYEYLLMHFEGYHFHAAYPQENKQAIEFMEKIGAKLIDFDHEMTLSRTKYNPMDDIDNIIMLDERYYDSLVEIHNGFHPDVYWTGERLLKALDKFDIFIILDENKVLGSIVTSKFIKKKREIYLMGVIDEKQNYGYERALLNKSVKHAFNNGAAKIMAMVDKSNLLEMTAYEELGFKKTDTCLTYSMILGVNNHESK